ncbi:AraC family transcriptional regulator [Gemmatimonas sp.]
MIDRVRRMTAGGNVPQGAGAARATVASGMVRGVLEYAVSRGACEVDLLAACGVARELLQDADARVPLARYVSLIHSAQRQLACDAFALHFGQSMSLASLSVVGMLCDAAPTMRDSLARMNRYASLITDTGESAGTVREAPADRFVVVNRGTDSWLEDRRPTFADFPEQVEITFAFIASAMRRYARHATDRFVHEVHVTHAQPRYVADYARIFGVPVRFARARNALRIDAAWLDRPLGLQPAWAGDILCEHADRQLHRLRAQQTLSGRVAALLRAALAQAPAPQRSGVSTDSMPDVESLARTLHMSRATLARQLREEGTSFTHLARECRRELADEYLAHGGATVKEAAFRLGFSDPAAFSRAYKRWTGRSPVEATQSRI